MENLNIRNFFTNFLLHPKSDQLNTKEQKIALGFSITVGICSAGLVHLTAKIIEVFRKTKTASGHSETQLPVNISSPETCDAAQLPFLVRSFSKAYNTAQASCSEKKLHSIAISLSDAYNASQAFLSEKKLHSIAISLSDAYNASQAFLSEKKLHSIAISLSDAYNASQASLSEKKLHSIASSSSEAYEESQTSEPEEKEDEKPLERRRHLPIDTPQTSTSGSGLTKAEGVVSENEVEPASEGLTLRVSKMMTEFGVAPDPLTMKINDQMTLSMWINENNSRSFEYMEKTSFQEAQEQVIRDCFSDHQGFILGEMHTSRNSKRFLIENMPLFAELGVKKLFIEWTEEEELLFEKFYSNPDIDEEFQRRLLMVDVANIPRPEFEPLRNLYKSKREWNEARKNHEFCKKYNHYQLFLAAKKHGIRLVPIDSFNLRRGMRPAGVRRLPAMNQFAERKIKRMTGSEEKYIVYCGVYHAFQVKRDEPGLNVRLGGLPVIYPSEFSKGINNISKTPEQRIKLPDYYVQYATED